MRAIQGGRWLYQWLQGALELVARGVAPEQAARQEAWRAPATFRSDLAPVAAELVERIHELKRDLATATERAGLDPVAWLDLNRAGWRESLPVDMSDHDARTLIERVVRRAEKNTLGGITLQRGLVRGNDGLWDFTVSLKLDGRVEHRHLPQDLGTNLAGRFRARIKPTGDLLAIVAGDLAILESYEEDEVAWWRVRALRRITDAVCSPALRIDLAVESDGAALGHLVLPDAQPLNAEPMAFVPRADRDRQLDLVARGSHVTRAPYLVIAIPRESTPHLTVAVGSVEELGAVRDLDLQLFRIEGETRLTADSETYRWRSGEVQEVPITLEIEGAVEPDVRGFAWRPPLQLFMREGSFRHPIKEGDVRWRPAHGGAWRSWPDAKVRGDATFVLLRDGYSACRLTTSIVPSGFSIAATSGSQRSLAISGLAGAAVSVEKTTRLGAAADLVIVNRVGASTSHFSLDAIWPDGTSWRTELYDRTARPGFTDMSGAELRPGWHGCINALFGVYASCPDHGKLTIEALPTGSKSCVTRLVRGETPLYALAADIRALLATTVNLDAKVRLQWLGAGTSYVDIGLFDVALEVRGSEVWPSYVQLAAAAPAHARVTLLASPLANPPELHALHDGPLQSFRMQRFSIPSAGPGGPWLVYGLIDERSRIRPRVVFAGPVAAARRTRLMELVLNSETSVRRQRLTELLQSADIVDSEIDELRRLVCAFQPRVPLQSLDVAAALIEAPAAAVRVLSTCSEGEVDRVLSLEQEMNFLWAATPVRAWRQAFESKKANLLRLMATLPAADAERYAQEEVANLLQAIVARQPALALHALAAGGSVDNWHANPAAEANDCVARNGHGEDGVTWPTDAGLATRLTPNLPTWISGKQPYCWDVLAAPLVAARVAAGILPAGQPLIASLRWARLFDPVYFDRLLPNILLPIAAESPTHA
jgi:hypothetical protein